MEYTNITALVPTGEHFDSSAINEGVYLTVAHVNAIEKSLGGHATALADQALQAQQAVAAQQTAEASLATANQTIADRDATIVAKDAEIAKLKAGPAADMKETAKDKDDLGGKDKAVDPITAEANRLRELRDGVKK